jgi:hypothetical protein
MDNEFTQMNNNNSYNLYDIESNEFINNEFINNDLVEDNISRPFYQIKKSISYPNKINNYEIELISSNNPIIKNTKKSNLMKIQINKNNQTDLNDSVIHTDLNDSVIHSELLIEKSDSKKIYYWSIKIYNFLRLNKINKIELVNKLLSVFLHIFIMVIFEIYFYFNYVIQIERNEFLKKINSYLNQIESNTNFNQIQKETIKHIFESQNYGSSFINYLYEQYIQSLQEQKKILKKLLIIACKMGGVIGLVLLILFGFGLANRKKIKWNWILFENFLMFVLLGIFEYLFFTNIILHYNPITDAEIKYFVANNLYNYFNSTSY